MADRADFADQAMEYAPQLYSAALRMTRNRADAEDLVQEVFLQAARGWKDFEGRSNPMTWLYTIAARFGAKALTIATISDCLITHEQLSPDARQESLVEMVQLALDTFAA